MSRENIRHPVRWTSFPGPRAGPYAASYEAWRGLPIVRPPSSTVVRGRAPLAAVQARLVDNLRLPKDLLTLVTGYLALPLHVLGQIVRQALFKNVSVVQELIVGVGGKFHAARWDHRLVPLVQGPKTLVEPHPRGSRRWRAAGQWTLCHEGQWHHLIINGREMVFEDCGFVCADVYTMNHQGTLCVVDVRRPPNTISIFHHLASTSGQTVISFARQVAKILDLALIDEDLYLLFIPRPDCGATTLAFGRYDLSRSKDASAVVENVCELVRGPDLPRQGVLDRLWNGAESEHCKLEIDPTNPRVIYLWLWKENAVYVWDRDCSLQCRLSAPDHTIDVLARGKMLFCLVQDHRPANPPHAELVVLA